MAPFSTDLAPRFQVNDATMRRSDWWKEGHVGVETIWTKRSWSFSIQSLDSSDVYIKAFSIIKPTSENSF